jgi:hypothetical protein
VIKKRKVGTFSLGIILVVFGLLFLSRLLFPAMEYQLIAQFWPVIFVILGVEILFMNGFSKEELVYDGAGIILIVLLSFFAMAMAVLDFFIQYGYNFIY